MKPGAEVTAIDFLRELLRSKKGDNLERLRASFLGLSSSEMEREFGASGKTRAAHLREACEERQAWKDANELLERSLEQRDGRTCWRRFEPYGNEVQASTLHRLRDVPFDIVITHSENDFAPPGTRMHVTAGSFDHEGNVELQAQDPNGSDEVTHLVRVLINGGRVEYHHESTAS